MICDVCGTRGCVACDYGRTPAEVDAIERRAARSERVNEEQDRQALREVTGLLHARGLAHVARWCPACTPATKEGAA